MSSLNDYLNQHLESIPLTSPVSEEPLLQRIGRAVKQKRKASSISQQELSKMTGVSQGIISKIENGLYNPSLIELGKLLAPLGATIEVR